MRNIGDKFNDEDWLEFCRIKNKSTASTGGVILSSRRMNTGKRMLDISTYFTSAGFSVLLICNYENSANSYRDYFIERWGDSGFVENIQFLTFEDYLSGNYIRYDIQAVFIVDVHSLVKKVVGDGTLVCSSVLLSCNHNP